MVSLLGFDAEEVGAVSIAVQRAGGDGEAVDSIVANSGGIGEGGCEVGRGGDPESSDSFRDLDEEVTIGLKAAIRDGHGVQSRENGNGDGLRILAIYGQEVGGGDGGSDRNGT